MNIYITLYLILSTQLILTNNIQTSKRFSSETQGGSSIFSMVAESRQLEKHLNTKSGAFLSGLSLNLAFRILFKEKDSLNNCNEVRILNVMQCFVGESGLTLDSYYENVKDIEKDVIALTTSADVMAKMAEKKGFEALTTIENEDEDIHSESYLSTIKKKFKWAAKAPGRWVESVNNFFKSFGDFLESPNFKAFKLFIECMMNNMKNKTNADDNEFKTLHLKNILLFGTKSFLHSLTNTILSFPTVIKTIYKAFMIIKEAYTKKYETELEKYFNYGKSLSTLLWTVRIIYKINPHVKSLKNFVSEKWSKMRSGGSKKSEIEELST